MAFECGTQKRMERQTNTGKTDHNSKSSLFSGCITSLAAMVTHARPQLLLLLLHLLIAVRTSAQLAGGGHAPTVTAPEVGKVGELKTPPHCPIPFSVVFYYIYICCSSLSHSLSFSLHLTPSLSSYHSTSPMSIFFLSPSLPTLYFLFFISASPSLSYCPPSLSIYIYIYIYLFFFSLSLSLSLSLVPSLYLSLSFSPFSLSMFLCFSLSVCLSISLLPSLSIYIYISLSLSLFFSFSNLWPQPIPGKKYNTSAVGSKQCFPQLKC